MSENLSEISISELQREHELIENIVLDQDISSNQKYNNLFDQEISSSSYRKYVYDNLSFEKEDGSKFCYIKVNENVKEIRPASLIKLKRSDYINIILDRNIVVDLDKDLDDCKYLDMLTRCDYLELLDFSNPNIVTKKEMKNLLLENDVPITLDFLRSKPYTSKNLENLCRFIQTPVSRDKSLDYYCRKVGIPHYKYGYKIDILLFARHLGFENTDRDSAYKSYKFLDITPYPGSIVEAASGSERIANTYGEQVDNVRRNLKEVIRDMKRTKLVKAKILNLFLPDLSPSPQNYWSIGTLDKLLRESDL